MLRDHFFGEKLSAVEQTPVERRPVGDGIRPIAVHAGSRLTDRLLDDDGAVALDEIAELVRVVGRDRHPFAMEKRRKRLVERDLVVELGTVARIVVSL